MTSLVLLVNLAATWFMVGLIWMIQLVHYRQFPLVGRDGWTAYHRDHSRRISWIVVPVMLIEAASAVALAVATPSALTWAGVGLVALIWLSTACLQVPLHRRLANEFDEAACCRLTAGNWVRTILWTSRGLLTAWMMLGALRS
jgi:hypothetical protein